MEHFPGIIPKVKGDQCIKVNGTPPRGATLLAFQNNSSELVLIFHHRILQRHRST